ncbi:unnamed protein product [Linum tenue]|uniref:endo-polygalacturonase n=1 Tax=Linum tenue TaxID=586396 RepID=A0AAV0QH02_9ROSI|nr:unnamed protein product [Linum tenue]
MERNRRSWSWPLPLFSVFLIAPLLFSVLIATTSVEARKHHHSYKNTHNRPHTNKHSNHRKGSDSGGFNPPADSATDSTTYNVVSFGARGDGVTDDSQALVGAWKAACQLPGATVKIPSGFRFLMRPVNLQGPCKGELTLQIDGTLLAPSRVGDWPKSSMFQWLNFKWVQNFTIQGSGTVDGQGSQWWTPSSLYYVQKMSKYIPDLKPTALRFYSSHGVTVRDIRIVNSPQCHLKFDYSGGIKVDNITISSPENSPNTDGIHLQSTRDVEIHHSNIGCGDDCVSIQSGCSNVHLHHINCSPGHGISVGSLGKDKSAACVSNIVVDNISLRNTLAGVRIKTWQGGVGSVKNVSFTNIQVSDVKYPIIIDQFYCDKHRCENQTAAVAISGVKYDQIYGTYTAQPIRLACSTTVPCVDVDVADIQLKPSIAGIPSSASLCWNSYGKSQAPLLPSSIDGCLRRDTAYVKRVARSHEHVC